VLGWALEPAPGAARAGSAASDVEAA
jgi:hypothetical protein